MTAVDDAIEAILGGSQARDLETETLEFKQETDSPKRTLDLIADAVVCFANADGGTVVLGVADSGGGPDAILGVTSALDEHGVLRGIFDRTRPALSVPVRSRSVRGIRLLEITVPMGATFYSNAKGTSTRRIGTDCMPFPPEQQRQALAARGMYDWSSQPSGARSTDDGEMARLRRLLRRADKTDLAARDDATVLRDLRLVTRSGELTRAGLLLVGRNEDVAEHVPSYGYSYSYKPTPGSEATGGFRGVDGLLSAVEQLLDAVEARRSRRPLNLAGGVQLRLEDYPEAAVRELVVNALVHRDFEAAGSVDIEHSPDQVRITSPGALVFGVTPENILTHPSTPRNRLLLEVVTLLQVAERTGQGVDRAYRELLRNGKQPPQYLTTDAMVDVRIPGGAGEDAFIRYVHGDLPETLAADIDVLLVLHLLRTRRTLDARVASASLQRSQPDSQAALERIAEAGVIEPSRRTAGRGFPTYSLTASALTGLGRAVVHHRRHADGADDKVLEHVHEYGFVTNQTLRRMFDIDVYQARDMLRDMQTRELIRKIGKAERGPGIRYEATERPRR